MRAAQTSFITSSTCDSIWLECCFARVKHVCAVTSIFMQSGSHLMLLLLLLLPSPSAWGTSDGPA
jgi:hypothetical protein